MAESTEFYVGYLRTPPRLAAFWKWAAPGVIAATLAAGWFLSRSQNDPGDGVWQDGLQTFVGRVAAVPYAHIRVASRSPGAGVETILLVSEGKRGGAAAIAGLDGRMARVTGTLLERDGLKLLELSGDAVPVADDALSSGREVRPAAPATASLGAVTLRGEIIDPKCYSGAMKPGEGKTHKACATLCIAGGIPPMFVSIDEAGRRSYYLLAGRDGGALDERILPFVADPVEVTGELERRDDLQVLRIDPTNIRRR